MTTRRSSVKGRGSEILFGAPQAVKIKPLPSRRIPAIDNPPKQESEDEESGRDQPVEKAAPPSHSPPTQPEAGSAEKEPAADAVASALAAEPDDAEVLAGLAQEARDAQALPEGPTNQALPETSATPAPQVEPVVSDKIAAAKESPDPVVEAPIPPLEVTMEDKSNERTLYKVPPPETSDAAGDVLPPRPSAGFIKISDLDSVGTAADIQSTGEPEKPLELPERALTEEEKQKILARLGSARLQELEEEISKAYDQVLSVVGENADLTTECYNQLLKGREILLLQDVARIPQVEYYIEQVRARLRRASQSKSGAKKYAWLIAGWGLFWFLVFTSVLVGLNYTVVQNQILPATAPNTPVDMVIFLPAMVWGGIGGVAAVFYSLFKHVGRRDFDTQFNLSYVGKPFLGVILGATVYMIVHLLIMTLGILPAGLAQGGETVQAPTVTPWIIYLLAWACGFKENRIFDLVDRVMKRIFSGEEEEATAGPPAPAT